MSRVPYKSKWPLILGVAGPSIWAGSGFLAQPLSAWIGAVGAIVGVVGAIWAHQVATTFELRFNNSDWRNDRDGFVISISPYQHRRGDRPIVQVNSLSKGGGYEEVIADSRTLPDGTVELGAAQPFAGRILIQ